MAKKISIGKAWAQLDQRTDTGAVGVSVVTEHGRDSFEVFLSVRDARKLAAEILAEAEKAERGESGAAMEG